MRCSGRPAYDVASLLQDARVDVPADLELRLLALYARLRGARDPSFDMARSPRAYAVMGAQRATKILGIFTRLDRRDGKPQYLQHLPRIERTLAKNLAHPVAASAAALVRGASAARARRGGRSREARRLDGRRCRRHGDGVRRRASATRMRPITDTLPKPLVKSPDAR